MWVKDDEWTDTLQWQEEEAREEFSDIRIPLDKEGADIYYSVIAPEPKFRTQLIYQAAAIMHAAGVDWTMPAEPGWDNFLHIILVLKILNIISRQWINIK